MALWNPSFSPTASRPTELLPNLCPPFGCPFPAAAAARRYKLLKTTSFSRKLWPLLRSQVVVLSVEDAMVLAPAIGHVSPGSRSLKNVNSLGTLGELPIECPFSGKPKPCISFTHLLLANRHTFVPLLYNRQKKARLPETLHSCHTFAQPVRPEWYTFGLLSGYRPNVARSPVYPTPSPLLPHPCITFA